jgi:multidrug efflux pump subunit AcrA (membrane-fusion protein)
VQTTLVKVRVYDAEGNLVSGATVQARLVSLGLVKTEGFVNRQKINSTTDVNGEAELLLLPTAETGAQYRVVARNEDGSKLLDALIDVPATADIVWLHDLVKLESSGDKGYDVDYINALMALRIRASAAMDAAQTAADETKLIADAAAQSAADAQASADLAAEHLAGFSGVADDAAEQVAAAKAASDAAILASEAALPAAQAALDAANRANTAATLANTVATDANNAADDAMAAAAAAMAAAKAATDAAKKATDTANQAAVDAGKVRQEYEAIDALIQATGLIGHVATPFGKSLLAAKTIAEAVSTLGLGTASKPDLSLANNTVGRTMLPGSYGLGTEAIGLVANTDGSGFYYTETSDGPISSVTRYIVIQINDALTPTQIWFTDEEDIRLFVRQGTPAGLWGPFNGGDDSSVDLTVIQKQIDALVTVIIGLNTKAGAVEQTVTNAGTKTTEALDVIAQALAVIEQVKIAIQSVIDNGSSNIDHRLDAVTADGWRVAKAADRTAERTLLELKTGAYAKSQTSLFDTTAGAILLKGAFGLGGIAYPVTTIASTSLYNGIYSISNETAPSQAADLPIQGQSVEYVVLQTRQSANLLTQLALTINLAVPRIFLRSYSFALNPKWSSWKEFGNGVPDLSGLRTQLNAVIDKTASANSAITAAQNAIAPLTPIDGKVTALKTSADQVANNIADANATSNNVNIRADALDDTIDGMGEGGGGGGSTPAANTGDFRIKRVKSQPGWLMAGSRQTSADYPSLASMFPGSSGTLGYDTGSEVRAHLGAKGNAITKAAYIGEFLVARTSDPAEAFMVFDKDLNRIYTHPAGAIMGLLFVTKNRAFIGQVGYAAGYFYNIKQGVTITATAYSFGGGGLVGAFALDDTTDIMVSSDGSMKSTDGSTYSAVNPLNACKWVFQDVNGGVFAGASTPASGGGLFEFNKATKVWTQIMAVGIPAFGACSMYDTKVYYGVTLIDMVFDTVTRSATSITTPAKSFDPATYAASAGLGTLWVTYNNAGQNDSYLYLASSSEWIPMPKLSSTTISVAIGNTKMAVVGDYGNNNPPGSVARNCQVYDLLGATAGTFVIPPAVSPLNGFAWYVKS